MLNQGCTQTNPTLLEPSDKLGATVPDLVQCYTGKQHAHGRYVVIKTHCWSDGWDTKEANHIFLTHRDLSGVVASYRRVGWAFNIPDSYVQEHQQWRVCHALLHHIWLFNGLL